MQRVRAPGGGPDQRAAAGQGGQEGQQRGPRLHAAAPRLPPARAHGQWLTVIEARGDTWHVWLSPPSAQHELVGGFSGLRPATEHQDYVISLDTARGWVTVAGIRYVLR